MTATATQYMPALASGQSKRLERARLRRSIAELSRPVGCLRVAELLEEPPDVIDTLLVSDLLQWVHMVGRSQARSILRFADPIGVISEFRQVRELTERQRIALADHLYLSYRGARRLGGITR
jgi:hypothetical protein